MKLNDIKTLFPHFHVDTFEHVLGHVSKAAGKLHGLVGDADHIEEAQNRARSRHIFTMGEGLVGADSERDVAFRKAEAENGKAASAYIADLIICAAKLAASCPSGEIDLEKAVADRMAEKRDYLKQYDRSEVIAHK